MTLSLYDRYKSLLGLSYVEGDQDCYGLLRAYYKKNYDLELENYARPGDFARSGVDLIMDYFKDEGFELIETNLNSLQLGDGIMFTINGSPLCNHVGVYVGNFMILHHLFNGLSREDAFTTKWKARVTSVVRHPEVTKRNESELQQVNMADHINPHDFPSALISQ